MKITHTAKNLSLIHILLLNACVHTPAGTPITLKGGADPVRGQVWLDAVSYTHLDVYKRQNRGSPIFVFIVNGERRGRGCSRDHQSGGCVQQLSLIHI